MTTVVFGEALIDDFISEQAVGGAPFNVARHLAAFMAVPLMITRIGSDRNGATVDAQFERFAMSRNGLQVDPMEETGRVVAERGAGGQRLVFLPEQAYDFIDPAAALAAAAGVTASTVYFGTLAQRSARSREALYLLLGASAATRFLDLNLPPGQAGEAGVSTSLHAADIVKVNEQELQLLFQWYCGIDPAAPPQEREQVHAACAELVRRFTLQGLIVTLGHRGSVYFADSGAVTVQRDNPALPFVIDTVGAGDAFAAIFLLGRERGWPLALALARANEFAGAICAIAGALPRDLAFYDKWVARWGAA